MKRRFSFLFIAVGILISLQSCQKGTAGPTGATGPQGPAGSTGPQGVAGDTGTANVIYSTWATVTFTGSGTTWYASIAAPGVTQSILDQGEVKTYFQFGSEVYDGNYSNLATDHSIFQYLTLGSINLSATFNATYPWRYVIIPGGVAGSIVRGIGKKGQILSPDGTAMDGLDLKAMNYQQICQLFNIPQ
jgi:hypothetical protein